MKHTRLALAMDGVCQEVLSGIGVIEVAIMERKWTSVRRMFVELASSFGGAVAWDGTIC